MVVGHEHADRRARSCRRPAPTGTSTSSERPGPGCRLNRTLPPERADALPHSGQPHVALALEPLGPAVGWARGRRPAPRAARRPAPPRSPTSTSARRRGARRWRAPPAARGTARAPPPSRAEAACRGAVQRDADAAALAEIGHQRAEGREQAEVVQQRRPEVVGHAPDAPDPGVDQPERPIQPLGLRRADRVPEHAQLHLDGGEDLRGLVVQLAREPPALLLVLLHHAGGEPGQLDGAGLQPACRDRRSPARRPTCWPSATRNASSSAVKGSRASPTSTSAPIDLVAPEERAAPPRRDRRAVPAAAPRAGHLRPAGLERAARAPRRGALVGSAPPRRRTRRRRARSRGRPRRRGTARCRGRPAASAAAPAGRRARPAPGRPAGDRPRARRARRARGADRPAPAAGSPRRLPG